MGQYSIVKQYNQHGGLDLKSSDLSRLPIFVRAMKNAQYRKSGSVEKRPGFQTNIAGQVPPDSSVLTGGFGTWSYHRIDPETGAETADILTADRDLWKRVETVFEITYTGTSASCLLDIFYDPSISQYRITLTENGVLLNIMNLGVGFDEATTVKVSDVVNTFNGLATPLGLFSAAVTAGSAFDPAAAFIPVVRSFDFVKAFATSAVLRSASWARIPCSLDKLSLGHAFADYIAARKTDSDFENVSAVQLSNVMYFGTGHTGIYKYDGATFYLAGLPTPDSVTSALNGAGAITGSNYIYRIQYKYSDAGGNLFEGNFLQTTNPLNPTAQSINVTVANVLFGSGFNTGAGVLVNPGPFTNTNFTVDDGSGGPHTLHVGDVVHFQIFGGDYTGRTVIAADATSITISGAAVTVDSLTIFSVISIEIWRNKTSATFPTVFFLVAEISNNPFASTQTVNDNVTDVNLGALMIPPATDRSPPPPGRYVSHWQGSLFVAGMTDDPHLLAWSDVAGIEYFPTDNQELIETVPGDKIAGIAPNRQVFGILKDRSFAVLSGNIGLGQTRIDIISTDTGCSAHASISEINGALVWISDRGPRTSASGSPPMPLGEAMDSNGRPSGASRIDPAMDKDGLDSDHVLRLKRSVVFHDRIGQRIWFCCPAEGRIPPSSITATNANTRTFVYEYTRDAWCEWSNFDFSGGAATIDIKPVKSGNGVEFEPHAGSEIFIHERGFSLITRTLRTNLSRKMNLLIGDDYQDNTDAIFWDYAPQWEALGEPSVLKKFPKIRVNSLEDAPAFDLTLIQEVNFQNDNPRATITIQNVQGTGYGENAYGNDSYGDPAAPAKNRNLIRDRIRAVSVRFQNQQAQKNVVISGWELEAISPYDPEIKS